MEIEALRPRHRFTVRDYYRMAEDGILEPDVRVELIEGEILEMPPIGPPHAATVTQLSTQLTLEVAEEVTVRTQLPVRLSDRTEPQPDICLIRSRPDAYRLRHPEPDDILLVIEVSDSSVAYDRIKKGRLYSRSWIPEYWLVDIPGRRLEVYRSPGREGYTEREDVPAGARVSPQALPEVSLEVGAILGP